MALKEISPNAMAVLQRRYLGKDENGKVTETVEDMFRRVADAVAAADTRYDACADTAALSAVSYTHLDVYKRQSLCHASHAWTCVKRTSGPWKKPYASKETS